MTDSITTINLGSNNLCPGRDSNQVDDKYISTTRRFYCITFGEILRELKD
jgi:hypothetical protein